MEPKSKRILIGCATGCGGLLLLLVLVAVSFGFWVTRPGELLEPSRLLGPDTVGYVEWTLRLEDSGTEGFAELLIETLQEPSPELQGLPTWLVPFLARQQAKEAEQDIRNLFPLVAGWTLHPGHGADEDLHLLTVSLQRFGNRIVLGDWILGLVLGFGREGRVIRHGDEKIYPLDAVTVFMRGNDLFFTSDVDTARQAIDRLRAEARARPSSGPVDALFAETAERGPLRGALSNDRGELQRLWRQVASASALEPAAELWRSIRGVSLAGGLREDGSLAARLDVVCPDANVARAQAPGIAALLRDGIEWGELAPQVEARPEGNRIVVDLRFEDVIAAIRDDIRNGVRIPGEGGSIRIDP